VRYIAEYRCSNDQDHGHWIKLTEELDMDQALNDLWRHRYPDEYAGIEIRVRTIH